MIILPAPGCPAARFPGAMGHLQRTRDIEQNRRQATRTLPTVPTRTRVSEMSTRRDATPPRASGVGDADGTAPLQHAVDRRWTEAELAGDAPHARHAVRRGHCAPERQDGLHLLRADDRFAPRPGASWSRAARPPWAKRTTQSLTVWRLVPVRRATSRAGQPSAASRTMRLRRARRWGLVAARAHFSSVLRVGASSGCRSAKPRLARRLPVGIVDDHLRNTTRVLGVRPVLAGHVFSAGAAFCLHLDLHMCLRRAALAQGRPTGGTVGRLPPACAACQPDVSRLDVSRLDVSRLDVSRRGGCHPAGDCC